MKKKNNKKCAESALLLKLMIVCVALSIVMLGIVAYDKLIRQPACEETCECANK